MPTSNPNDLIDKLNAKLAVPDDGRNGGQPYATFEVGEGGLTRVVLCHRGATAHVYQHGAHVTHYQPADSEPVLWMSSQSEFNSGTPIRGGIPVCFPWFGPRQGDPDAPGHGFVRTRLWKVRSITRQENGIKLTLIQDWSPITKKFWDGAFAAVMDITLSDTLTVALTVTNHAKTNMTYEAALHSYFAVSDAKQIALTGLQGTQYIDKLDNLAIKTEEPDAITFTGETDRVYLDTQTTVDLNDPGANAGAGRSIAVSKSGSASTVIWNPWIDKSQRMPDFGDDEWPGMACIETANVDRNAVTLAYEESHTMSVTIKATALDK